MNKSILILEENSIVHGLIASALDVDGLSLHHEFDPKEYVERAKALMPDLILISNADQARNYAVCRELKADKAFARVPLVLLLNSRDRLGSEKLAELKVDGVIRKPFEASDLQQQVSKHLNLVDLVGSAYEYKKSQSLREEGMNPLADMEVLDAEILDFLHGTAEAAAPLEPQVPVVDFSRELAGEAPTAPAAETPGGYVGEAMLDEAMLEETLTPESAFEMVEQAAPVAPPPGGEREGRAATDLYPEEAPEEDLPPPQAFDQALDEAAGQAAEEIPLDEVELELAGADIDFSSVGEDLEEEAVPLFETTLEEGGGEEAPLPVEEEIPAAVRRMVELKPVLSMRAETPAREDREVDFTPDSEELALMAEELELLEEIQIEEEFQRGPLAAPAPAAPPETPAAETKVESDEEEEFFHEDYLGDDEIDEAKISEALAYAPAEETEEPAELEPPFVAEALEEARLQELETMEELELEESTEAEDVIAIDADEESMVLSSIESDAEELELGEEPALIPPGMAEPELETALEGEEPMAFLEEEGLLDRQLEALEGGAAEAPAGGEAVTEGFGEPEAVEAELSLGAEESGQSAPFGEAGPFEVEALTPEEEGEAEAELVAEARFDEDSGLGTEEMTIDFGPEEEEELDVSGEELTGLFAEAPEEELGTAFAGEPGTSFAEEPGIAFPEEELGTAFTEEATTAFPEEELEMAFAGEPGAPAEEPYISEEARAMAAFAAPEPIAPPSAAAAGGVAGGALSFEDEFRELQQEIESNPIGERLEDVLAKEGIMHAVDEMEFQIPQHESPFARGMGVMEIPGQAALEEELIAGFATAPPPLLRPAAAPGASGAAAASGEVHLDNRELMDMIEASMRRVVKEELPKIMERMMREERGHGA